MKIKLSVQDLTFALKSIRDVAKQAGPGTSSNVLISTNKDRVSFYSMNKDLYVKASAAAQIIEEGKIVVGDDIIEATARFKVMNVAGTDGTSDISITTGPKNLTLSAKTLFKSGSSSDHTRTFPIINEAFPGLPETQDKVKFRVSLQDLKPAIQDLYFSLLSDDRLPILNSYFVELSKTKATFATTNGVCVAESNAPIETLDFSEETTLAFNLSHTFLNKVVRSYPDDETITVVVGANSVYSYTPNLFIYSPLVYGKFPDYKSVFPTDPKEILIEKEILLFNTANLQQEASKSADNRVHISAANGKMSIVAKSFSNDDIAISDGPPFKFDCNLSYLVSCVKGIKSEKIKIAFSGAGKPIGIFPSDLDTFRSLLVPLNK